MITQLHLKNWKSYENTTLYIDALSALQGTNASGKSNVLDALFLLNRTASGSMLTTALTGVRGGLEWAVRKPGNTFSVGITCESDENTEYEYWLEAEIIEKRCELLSETLIRHKYKPRKSNKLGKQAKRPKPTKINLLFTDSALPESPSIVARLYNEKSGSPRQCNRAYSVIFQLQGQKLRQEIQEGVQAVIFALQAIFILDPIPSHMRNYEPLSEQLLPDASNIAGVLAALPPEKQKEIEGTLTEYGSRLPERDIRRVYAETVGKFNSDAMLYCEEHWQDADRPSTVDARGMSDGTLRFLAILTALLTRPEGSLLVVEEVDNGLHPSRAHLLLEVLKTIGERRKVDVLVTTHNPALLDAMSKNMLPYLFIASRDPHSGCSVLTALEDLQDLPKLLAKDPIGQLASKGLIEKSIKKQLNQMSLLEENHA
jgi:predicted ATPase